MENECFREVLEGSSGRNDRIRETADVSRIWEGKFAADLSEQSGNVGARRGCGDERNVLLFVTRVEMIWKTRS